MNSPVSTRKRCRDRIGSANESPLSRLLDQLKSLQRVAFISAGEANLLLSHLVVECLKDCVKIKNAEHLTAILSSYGWSCSEAAFTTPVNLAGLATAISKYRWVRVQELGSGSYAVVYKVSATPQPTQQTAQLPAPHMNSIRAVYNWQLQRPSTACLHAIVSLDP